MSKKPEPCQMTLDEIIHVFENCKLVSDHFTLEAVTAAYVEALAALRDRRDTTEANEPLTLEELRGMDGEPVYLVGMEPIEYGWRDQYLLIDADEDIAYNGSYQFDLSRCAGLAYRRPPEGGEGCC